MLLNTARLNQTCSIFFWSKHVQCPWTRSKCFIASSLLICAGQPPCVAMPWLAATGAFSMGPWGHTWSEDFEVLEFTAGYQWYIYISVISGWVVWLRDFLLISSYFPFSGWALYRTEIWGCGPFPNAFRASPSRTVASLLALAVVALRSVLPGGNPITGGWQQKKIHNFKWNLWISRWISRQSTDSDCCDLYMNWIPSCRSTIYSNSQQAIYDKNDQLKLAGRFFHDVLMINTLCTKNLFFLLQRMEKPNCQASELRTPYVAIPVQVSGPGQYFFW